MSWFWVVFPIHLIASLFLILVILLQSGKSGDIAAAFGGGGSQTAFGPRGSSNVLTKATAVAAAIFMLTSLTLVALTQGDRGSVLDDFEADEAAAPLTSVPPTTPEEALGEGADQGPNAPPAPALGEEPAGEGAGDATTNEGAER